MTSETTTTPVGWTPEGEGWEAIETMPYGEVVQVVNRSMERPCKATRGYVSNGAVHEDQTFCTSVWTPDPLSGLGFPGGALVCPTHWRRLGTSHD
jgi:hypothetical protein